MSSKMRLENKEYPSAEIMYHWDVNSKWARPLGMASNPDPIDERRWFETYRQHKHKIPPEFLIKYLSREENY